MQHAQVGREVGQHVRLAVNYKIADDMMVYAQTSTGYKGGGVNPRPFYPTPPLNGVQYPPNPCALPASVLNFEYTKITNANTGGVTLSMITPYTPKRKASLGIQYEMMAGDHGSLTPRVDVAYQSEYFTGPINNPDYNQIDSRTTMNARVTWKDQANVWSAALLVNNLTDKMYYTTLFDNHTSVGYVSGQPAMPRNYALTVKRNFN